MIGTIQGVVSIKRHDDHWHVADRTLEGKHIHALVFEEQSKMWFAGVYKGGIFASHDGGETWEQKDNGITEPDIWSMASVLVDGKARLFAGSEPAHLFFSDDLGEQWSELPTLRDVDTVESWNFPAPPHIGHVKHINFAPGDPHTIFASIEQGGLLKSSDDGKSWVDIPGMNADVHRVVINSDRPARMYTTGGGGLWRTDDGGANWDNLTYGSDQLERVKNPTAIGGYPDQLVFRPSDPDYMLVSGAQQNPYHWYAEHTALARISRSRDGGATWEVLSNGLTDLMKYSVEAMCIEESPETVQVFAGTTNGEILWSEDAGDHWETIIEGIPPISKGGHYVSTAEQAV